MSDAAIETSTEATKPDLRGLWVYLAVLLTLMAAELVLAFVRVPIPLIRPLGVLVTIVVVATPMVALYRAASAPWNLKLAGIVLVSGILGQLLFFQASRHLPPSLLSAICFQLSQVGLLTWCLGLGAAVACIIKDRNLLLPIAFFLAAFDVFLVLTPLGFTQAIIKANPKLLASIAYTVPKVVAQPHPTTGPLRPYAFIGPADFLFLGMFFVALHRFGMRTRETLWFIVPTLLAYLAVVIFLGDVHLGRLSLGALPALLPIGAVVIAVNFREWKLNQEERLSTAVIGLLAIGLVVFGMTRKPPKEPVDDPANGTQTQAPPTAPGTKAAVPTP
jgi:hypothetical protein